MVSINWFRVKVGSVRNLVVPQWDQQHVQQRSLPQSCAHLPLLINLSVALKRKLLAITSPHPLPLPLHLSCDLRGSAATEKPDVRMGEWPPDDWSGRLATWVTLGSMAPGLEGVGAAAIDIFLQDRKPNRGTWWANWGETCNPGLPYMLLHALQLRRV